MKSTTTATSTATTQLISVKHLATILGVAPKTVYQWRSLGLHENLPPSIEIGGFVRYRLQDVEDFIEEKLELQK